MRLRPVPYEPELTEEEHRLAGAIPDGYLWHLDKRTDEEKAADKAKFDAYLARQDRRGRYLEYRRRMNYYNGANLPL